MSTTPSNTVKQLLITMLMLASVSTSSAWANGRHHGPRIGFGFGTGIGLGIGLGLGTLTYPSRINYSRNYYPGYYYPYQTTYYPEVLVETAVSPAPATVYVRQAETMTSVQPAVSANGSDWYYCHNPDGFYPSIKTCPSGWQRVPAQAPADR
ncbi:MAG: hypothetical protein Q7J77_03690 [Undibacterium sp.]|nr:hypothetical protein [Undibacterium sp.]